MQSTYSTRRDAAITHLRLLPGDDAATVALYVTLAFTYGIEVHEIAAETGLSLAAVRYILGGV